MRRVIDRSHVEYRRKRERDGGRERRRERERGREERMYLGCLEEGEAEGAQRLFQKGVRLGHAHVLLCRGRPGGINDHAREGGRERGKMR